MKGGIFGFSRNEVLWFTVFFIISLSLMTFSVIRLISKYYYHNSNTYSQIQKQSHDLWSLQDITLYAVNVQRGSLNLIIYANNSTELKNVKVGIQKNRDSLTAKLNQLERENQLEKTLRFHIEKAGRNYLDLNTNFLKIAENPLKKDSLSVYNVNVIRPVLRMFNDLTRQTGKLISQQIQKKTEKELNIFYQFEFWILLITLLPYLYFFCRFMYLVIKMIIWDISS